MYFIYAVNQIFLPFLQHGDDFSFISSSSDQINIKAVFGEKIKLK